VSERHDAAEQEAEEAAVEVALGGQVEITNAPSAAVSPGLMDWLNGPSVRKAVDAVSDLIPGANLARQAGAEVAYATGLAPGTPSIFDPRTSGPGGAGDGGGFLGALGRMWDAETAGQQRASGLVARGQHALEGLITSGESAITSTATGLAQSTQGIPVVGDLAGAGAAALGQITQGQGGFLRGGTTMLGGLGNALVNPIGTVSGVANLAADLPILGLPFLPSLRSLGTGAYDVLSGNAGLAETAGQVLNPLSSMETNRERLGPAIQHFTQPYEKAIGQGRYMEAVGRGVFDLGPFIMGMGGSSAAEGGGSAAGAVHGTNPVMEMPAVSAAEAAAGQMPRDWSAGAVGRARPPGFVGEMPAVQMEQVLAGAEPADFWRRAGRVSPASSAPAPPGPVPGTVIPTPDLPGPVDPFAPTSPGVDPLAPTWREPGPRRGGTVPGLGGHPDTIPGGFSKPNVKMFSPLDAIDRWLRRLREPGPD
jgi:hypothetical protein